MMPCGAGAERVLLRWLSGISGLWIAGRVQNNTRGEPRCRTIVGINLKPVTNWQSLLGQGWYGARLLKTLNWSHATASVSFGGV